jgi:hypothetical protein
MRHVAAAAPRQGLIGSGVGGVEHRATRNEVVFLL